MGRGVSAGGGQSSLGYLFGGGEAPPPQAPNRTPTSDPPSKPTAPATQEESIKQTPPAATSSFATNNYHRADGQNCGNFLTDRPSTKVHAAPGGNSSLNYLFGDGSNSSSSK